VHFTRCSSIADRHPFEKGPSSKSVCTHLQRVKETPPSGAVSARLQAELGSELRCQHARAAALHVAVKQVASPGVSLILLPDLLSQSLAPVEPASGQVPGETGQHGAVGGLDEALVGGNLGRGARMEARGVGDIDLWRENEFCIGLGGEWGNAKSDASGCETGSLHLNETPEREPVRIFLMGYESNMPGCSQHTSTG
jgi:hypothetical protein